LQSHFTYSHSSITSGLMPFPYELSERLWIRIGLWKTRNARGLNKEAQGQFWSLACSWTRSVCPESDT
jgi:hypothetical protein